MKGMLCLLLCLGILLGHAQQAGSLPLGSTMLDPSVYHVHRAGLANSFIKFTQYKKGRVAFMGGSITEHGAWRSMVCAYLQEKFPETQFEFINAGISSTGSTPGAFRFSTDLLSKGDIDLFFEEAAVNDATNGFGPVAQVRGMEGIIRQALSSNPSMDIIMLHFVDPEKIEDYHSGRIPEVIVQHEKVADRYRVNSIHLAREVAARIHAGEFNWKDDFKDLHPSPFGHQVYFSSIKTFLSKAYAVAADLTGPDAQYADLNKLKKNSLPTAIDPFSYTGGIYQPVSAAEWTTGWEAVADWIPGDGVATRPQYVHLPALVSTTPGATLQLQFSGTAIGLCVVSGPDAGMIEYSVDGSSFKRVDLFTQWSMGLHLPRYIVLEDELSNSKHAVVIRVLEHRNEKSKGNAIRILHFLLNTP